MHPNQQLNEGKLSLVAIEPGKFFDQCRGGENPNRSGDLNGDGKARSRWIETGSVGEGVWERQRADL